MRSRPDPGTGAAGGRGLIRRDDPAAPIHSGTADPTKPATPTGWMSNVAFCSLKTTVERLAVPDRRGSKNATFTAPNHSGTAGRTKPATPTGWMSNVAF